MRRANIAGMLVATAALAAPGSGAAQTSTLPEPSADADTAASVTTLVLPDSITTIALAESITRLQRTRTRGPRTTVTVDADVLFAFNRATLTPTARKTLARISARLRRAASIRVVGYTDSRGSNAYNDRLSRGRARAVAAGLGRDIGGAKIDASGRGESNPVAPNRSAGKDNPAGRARNRRVEISFARR